MHSEGEHIEAGHYNQMAVKLESEGRYDMDAIGKGLIDRTGLLYPGPLIAHIGGAFQPEAKTFIIDQTIHGIRSDTEPHVSEQR